MPHSHWLFHINANAAKKTLLWRLLLSFTCGIVGSVSILLTLLFLYAYTFRNSPYDLAIDGNIYMIGTFLGGSLAVYLLTLPLCIPLFYFLLRRGLGGIIIFCLLSLLLAIGGYFVSLSIIPTIDAFYEDQMSISKPSLFLIGLWPILSGYIITWLCLRLFHRALFEPETEVVDTFA